MPSPRHIVESRAGQLIVATVAAIAAGTAIPLYAAGVFNSPPPACYLSAPSSGASLVGAATLTAVCGTSTTNAQFTVDGSVVASASSAPFTVSWNSATVGDGTHTLTVFACDVTTNCVQTGAVTVTSANAPHAPVNTVAPAVSGALSVGSTDSCSQGTWTGDTSGGFTYQWKDGAGNISGATGTSYTIGSGENGLFLHCTVTASGASGSLSADSNTVGPVTSGGALTTAHVWVSTSGNDSTCKRNASLVDYATALAASPTNVCATGPAAYKVASLGDTVLIETSTFTSQWSFTQANTKTGTPGDCNYNYGGSSNLTQCITFEPATGQTATFNCSTGGCQGTGGQSYGIQVKVCVNYVSFQNFTWTETDYTGTGGVAVANAAFQTGKGDASCLPSGAPPHDIYLVNNTYGGGVGIVGGAYNVWLVGGLAATDTNFPWQLGGVTCLNGGACGSYSLPVNHSGMVGVTFDGFNFVTNSPSYHMECLHVQGGSENNTWAGDRFLSCPVEGLFLEANAAGTSGAGNNYQPFDSNLIENNYFDGGSALDIDCHATGCVTSNNIVRFNSFHNGTAFLYGDCTSSCTIDNNTFYGNLGVGCGTNTTHTGTGWIPSYNVNAGIQAQYCAGDSTSSYSQTITYASAGTPNYNLDLSGAQTATNFVPNSVTWPLNGGNIYGAARSGATTNAGAD